MNCFIGLDIGTSAVKGALISQEGDILTVASKGFDYYYYKESGKLMEPDVFVNTCFELINELASFGTDNKIVAICPCCASGNLLLLDDTYKPLTPIIGWQSTVPADEFNTYFTEEEKVEIYHKVGWRPSNSFPIAVLPWLKNNKSNMFKKAKMICMSAEYLNYVLTGEWGIGHSMGTPFYLMDQELGVYNKELLEKLEISEEKLPPIMNKGTVLGQVKPDLKLNLSPDTKVVLGSFDHPSGATGSGVYDSGDMLLSCGTSWVELFPVESRAKAMGAGFMADRFMLDGSPYCVMTSIASLSIKIDNLRTHYFGEISYKDFDYYASKSVLGCNGVRFSFTDDDFNKYSNADKCDIARAIIESAAEILKKNLNAVEQRGLPVDRITIIGGITNSDVCVKIISETIGKEITVVNGVSAGAVGAAMLAAIGAGAYKNEKDAYSKMNFNKKVFRP